MWKLNKMHDLGIQFVSNKENKEAIYNQLKYFTNGSFVHLVHFPCTVNVILLYNGARYPS